MIFYLSGALGLFAGVIAFIIIAIIENAVFALIMGIISAILFGSLLGAYLVIHDSIINKKYAKYRDQNIKNRIIYEDSFLNLNGSPEGTGHLFLTGNMLFMVVTKGKKILSEIKMPLASIERICQSHDYGHLANVLILQKDQTETRFITDNRELVRNLRFFIEGDVFDSESNQLAMSNFFKDEKQFKKLRREVFPLIADDRLRQAATAWVWGKLQTVELVNYLEVLSALPMPCQYVIAVNAIDGEVNNGGFNQYYFNESHLLPVKADDALRAIGALQLAEIANKADDTYIKMQDTLGNHKENTMEEFMASYENNPLNEFDAEYMAISETEKIEELLIRFIRENIDCFGD